MYGLQWTALMNFGGTDGIKGNMTHMNEIPFAALDAKTSVWGSGFTSEGIDQNPALCTSHFLSIWSRKSTAVLPLPGALFPLLVSTFAGSCKVHFCRLELSAFFFPAGNTGFANACGWHGCQMTS